MIKSFTNDNRDELLRNNYVLIVKYCSLLKYLFLLDCNQKMIIIYKKKATLKNR